MTTQSAPGEDADSYTDAMLAGAEVEQPSTEGNDVVHHPRTIPAAPTLPDRRPDRSLLTTDDEAQVDESVVNPENS